MELLLKRTHKKENYTIGELFLDGKFFCNTMEDKDRGLKDSMSEQEITSKKIPSLTAIPLGTYNITLDVVSPKYSKVKTYDRIQAKLPRLEKVKGYSGVLIHIGNTDRDSAGCILVGIANSSYTMVTNSTNTFFNLYEELKKAKNKGEVLTIKIE